MSKIKSKYIDTIRSIKNFILLTSMILSCTTHSEEVIPFIIKQKNSFIFNYFTEEPCRTVIFFSDTKKVLENLNETDVKELEEKKTNLSKDLYGKIILRKPGGSIDHSWKVAFYSTYHRIKIDANRIKKYYSLYEGDGKFSKIFVSPSKSQGLTSFALINHTRAELIENGKYRYYDKSIIDNILTFNPQYLFHSGDITNSIYNSKVLKEESLKVFNKLSPSVPIILSFSNHDVGWPMSFSQTGFLKTFLPFNYIGNSAHHITVFENVIILSIAYLSFKDNNNQDIINTIIEDLRIYKKPIIILTGGTLHLEQLKKIVKSLPYTKVVIGGDGGKYQEINLYESVKYIYLRHWDMFSIANIKNKTLSMEIRTSEGLKKTHIIDLLLK